MLALMLGLAWTAPVLDEDFRGRVEAVEKDKIILRAYQPGDSIEKPTGRKIELAIDAETRVLNIRAKDVNDEETRKKILAVGQVLIAKFAAKKEKETALVLQAIGG